jgi:hypothetical protein
LRRTRSALGLVAALAAVALVAPVAPAWAQAPASEAAVESAPATAGERGTTELRATSQGLDLVWVSPEPLPYVDAAPELRLDGRVLGRPTIAEDRRTLRLRVDADQPIDLASVEVWLGVRRLDLAGTPVQYGPRGPAETDGPTGTLPVDPGAEGGVATTTFDYEDEPIPWPEFPGPMEAVGHVVLPVGVPDAPLVVFLHGRHQPCYQADAPVTTDLACPGIDAPVPSHLGYDYLQQLLGSQGIASVSVAANVINDQDFRSPDGGAVARSELVRHHLGLIAGWDADPGDADWFGTVDLSRVVLVGHSRGGEGVDAAVIESDASSPWTIVGQVLIAPVDFSWQTAGYVPTSLFLPSCDGDVSDLQGQRYIDAAPTAAPDDPSLRSSVLMVGANHNFFNTEWTPGISAAPSNDDWFSSRDRDCGTDSVRRLNATEQRRVAKTYVAASVDAFVNGTQSSVNVLDRGDVVIPPGVPDARVRTHALGGRRTTLRPGADATLTGAARGCASVSGDPVDVGGTTLPPCGAGAFREVHWGPDLQFLAQPEVTTAGRLGAVAQYQFTWSAAGRVGGIAPTSALDVRGKKATVDLRVVADPAAPPARLAVRLGDGTTSWTSPTFTLQQFPGQAAWAQPIRVDLTDATVDRSAITSVALVSRSRSGRVVVLDTSVRRFGLTAVPDRDLPTLRLGQVTTPEGDGPADGVGLLPFTLTGDVSQPSSFGVSIDRTSYPGFREPAVVRVDVPAGVTSGTVEVPHEADTLDERAVKDQEVVASPLRGLAAADNRGSAEVSDDDADVTVRVTALHSPVVAGGRIGFRIRLSARYDDFYVGRIQAVLAPGVAQIRTIDVPDAWKRWRIPHPDVSRPLSSAIANSVQRMVFIDEGARSVDLTIPTLPRPLSTTRSMSIRVDGSPTATVRLR